METDSPAAAGVTQASKILSEKEKVCREHECEQQWGLLSPEAKAAFLTFVYCPYCSNELVIQCSNCHEQITDKDFKFCPWCGTNFE